MSSNRRNMLWYYSSMYSVFTWPVACGAFFSPFNSPNVKAVLKLLGPEIVCVIIAAAALSFFQPIREYMLL